MRKISAVVACMFMLLAALPGRQAEAAAGTDDNLSVAALVGRWGNSGVKYGFSDDGYFYRSTVLSHLNTRSTYIPSSRRYVGDYIYETSGRWEYSYYTTYTYLNTLFGQYRVRGDVIQFDNVVSISHSSFDREWHRKETRGPDDEKFLEKFQKAVFNGDFIAEFEFISSNRLRISDKTTDRDFFWDFEDVPRNVPIPTHVIPPVEWPAGNFSAEMPELKTKGRLRESSHNEEGKKTTLVIDKTDSLADIRGYVKILRGAGWWVEEPQAGAESLNLEARKGLWLLGIKNGNGPNSSTDTVVIESVNYVVGKWPQAWSDAKLEPPQKSVIIGNVDNKVDESDLGIREKLYFDKVNDKGVEDYAARLRQAGFAIPANADDKWRYMKYARVNGDLYRIQIEMDGRYGDITAFGYNFKYFPDGEWPAVWSDGGLPEPKGGGTIVGAIDMDNWDNKNEWYGSFSASVKFLGFDQRKMDSYFKELQSLGFARNEDHYGDGLALYRYLRLGGSLCRVMVEQRENDELAEILYSFKYFPDGEWPADWSNGGLPAPQGVETIVGAIDMDNWDNKDEWYGSFSVSVKFLGLDQHGIDDYFKELEFTGFARDEDHYGDGLALYRYLRLGGGLCRVKVEQRENKELVEILYSFRYFEDGEWPAVWSEGGLPAPQGVEAIVGAIDMENWDNKNEWYGSFSVSVKFLGLDRHGSDDYFRELEFAGFARDEDHYGDGAAVYSYLRFGGGLCRVKVEQRENKELVEILYSFTNFEEGQWPADWKSMGIPAPRCSAIVGAFDLEGWRDRESWYGSFSARMKFLDADLAEYAATLKRSGFTEPEYMGENWELEKRIRIGGVWHRVEISDAGNAEIPEVRYAFRKESD